MTNDLIARARAALDGVTPSKMPSLWRVTKRYSFISHKDTWQVVRDVPNSTAIDTIADTGGSGLSDERNARFIAAARDLVPALVDEVERLTTRSEAAEAMAAKVVLDWQRAERRANDNFDRAEAAEANVAKLVEALRDLHHAVCGETGFAECVRNDSGTAYPWPALDFADDKARAALAETEGDQK